MKYNYLAVLLLLVPACLGIYKTNGQSQNVRRTDPSGQITLMAGGGIAYYMGDISGTPGSGGLGLGPAFSLGAAYRLSEHFSARGELRLYKVSGDSKYTDNPEKNLSFYTTNPDLMLALQADLMPFSRRARVNPYALLGLGVTYLNPKADWNGATYKLAPLQTEGVKYSRLPLFFTGGLGVTGRINNRWSAGLELSGNFLLSDYLDDVSTVYPDPDRLSSDIARQLSYRDAWNQQPGYIRGNPKSKDSYILLTLKVHYALPDPRYAREKKRVRCPKN